MRLVLLELHHQPSLCSSHGWQALLLFDRGSNSSCGVSGAAVQGMQDLWQLLDSNACVMRMRLSRMLVLGLELRVCNLRFCWTVSSTPAGACCA